MAAKKSTTEADKAKAQRLEAIESAVGQIEKQFGKGSIMRLGDSGMKDIPVIPTGVVAIDRALGVGGVPKGRVVEIFGPESSGKTTLALQLVANVQRDGGVAAFVDAENALDPVYAQKLGVNPKDLLVSQPDSGEDALRIAELLVNSAAVDIVVIDSVAALVPKAELDGEIGDSHIGLQARLLSQALRKLTAILNRTNTCCVFINQIRMNINAMGYGSPETTPGGKALKFYSSVRMDIRRIGSIKDSKGEFIGNRTKIKIVKNKVAPPFKVAECDIIFNEGISKMGSLLDFAIDCKICSKKGGWFYFGEEKLGQGKENAKATLRANKPWVKQIFAQIKEFDKEQERLEKEKADAFAAKAKEKLA